MVEQESPSETAPRGEQRTPRDTLARFTRPVCSMLLGFAATASIAAWCLAGYSRFFASHTDYKAMGWIALFPDGWGYNSPTRMANTAVVVPILLASALALMVWRRTTFAWGCALLAGLGCVAYFVRAELGLTTFTTSALNHYLRSKQLPIALAAWWLAAAAAVAVTVALALWGKRPHAPRRLPLLGGVALGLVVALVATGAACRAGDDHRFVDATTAAPADVPALPEVLGQQRFHLKVADDTHTSSDGFDPVRVLAGGTGFLALARDTLTAYDHDGHERWHYRRTGHPGLTAEWFAVYGTVAIVKLGPGQSIPSDRSTIVALEAITGRQLWSSTDVAATQLAPMRHEQFDRYWHLAVGDGSDGIILLYDPATGRTAHVIHRPTNCDSEPTDTPTRLVLVETCGSRVPVEMRLVTIDPQTGTTVSTQHLFDITANPQNQPLEISPAGADGLQLDGIGIAGAPSTLLYFNAVTGRVVTEPAGTSRAMIPSQDPKGEYLVPGFKSPAQDGAGTALFGSDGGRRCVLAGDTKVQYRPSLGALPTWLGAQILVELLPDQFRQPDRLRLINRADCSVAADLPNTNNHTVLAMTAAPGVTVIASMDATGTYLDGYY